MRDKLPIETTECVPTREWEESDPIWAQVIRCPRCRTLIDDDEAGCRSCGLEVKHRTIGLGEIKVLSRDPDAPRDEQEAEAFKDYPVPRGNR